MIPVKFNIEERATERHTRGAFLGPTDEGAACRKKRTTHPQSGSFMGWADRDARDRTQDFGLFRQSQESQRAPIDDPAFKAQIGLAALQGKGLHSA